VKVSDARLLVSNTKLFDTEEKLQCLKTDTAAAAAAADDKLRVALTAAAEHKTHNSSLRHQMQQRDEQLIERDSRIVDLEQQLRASEERASTAAATAAKLEIAESKLATAVSYAVEVKKEAKTLKQQLAERDKQLAERDTTIISVELQSESERSGHATTKAELAAVSEQLLHTCSRLDKHEANAADTASKLKDIKKREAQLVAAAAKAEGIKRELRTLRKRDAEHEAALQQCRDDAVAAAAATTKQLKTVTEQFEELEERSVCVVCQHDPKQVLLQPCLHLRLCTKCSTSPKIKDCPICRAAIDYKETVHLC
jgi:chromosome segregation ATPase